MIVCNDVEMKGREKSGIRSEWVGDEFEVLTKVSDLKKTMKRWNT